MCVWRVKEWGKTGGQRPSRKRAAWLGFGGAEDETLDPPPSPPSCGDEEGKRATALGGCGGPAAQPMQGAEAVGGDPSSLSSGNETRPGGGQKRHRQRKK